MELLSTEPILDFWNYFYKKKLLPQKKNKKWNCPSSEMHDSSLISGGDINFKSWLVLHVLLAEIYLLKVNNRNTRTRCEICWKLTIKLPERRQWRRSGIFIVNFEHVIAGWAVCSEWMTE